MNEEKIKEAIQSIRVKTLEGYGFILGCADNEFGGHYKKNYVAPVLNALRAIEAELSKVEKS